MTQTWQLERERELAPWLDGAGLICKRERDGTLDGGDTLANCMTRLFCKAVVDGRSENLSLEYEYVCRMLNHAPGVWVRHPDSTKWYSLPDRISRDQLIPAVCSWIAFSDYQRAKDFELAHGRFFRGSGYLNGQDKFAKKMPWWARDIITPEFSGLLDRALREQGKNRPPSSKMKVGDFQMFLSADLGLTRKNLDLRNFILPLIASKIAYPTYWGDSARGIVNKDFLLHAVEHWFCEKPHYKTMRVRLGEPKPVGEWLKRAIEKVL